MNRTAAGVQSFCRARGGLGRATHGSPFQLRQCLTTANRSEPSAEALATWQRYAELSNTDGEVNHKAVNRRYVAPLQQQQLPILTAGDNAMGQMSEKHLKDEWNDEEIRDATRKNVVATWSSGAGRADLPIMVRGEGVYLYDSTGNEYMDMTSQAVCSNMGYTTDTAVKEAVMKQLDVLPYVYPGLGLTQIRARLCSLLAEITPGDVNGFVFPLGGSEANEGAIRIARRYTGKFKIMSAMRSYHGGTTGPLAATGDFRTKFAGEQAGYVKIFSPQSLRFSTGESDANATTLCLHMLEEQIIVEGPETIAGIMMETIVGANGVFLHPSGYLEGVRALCDKYNILLLLDEVMCGFWRTGPLFAFQHFQGVIPDIITSAKGLTSSIVPLGMIGMRQKIMDHFETNALGWGATYANHPVLLSCAYEVLRQNCLAHLEQKVATIEAIMLDEVDGLITRHSCVSQGRVIGAFGCLDLVRKDGQSLNLLGEALPVEAIAVRKSMKEQGLFGLFRSPMMHICPPLVITEVELRELFRRIDNVLTDLDAVIEA